MSMLVLAAVQAQEFGPNNLPPDVHPPVLAPIPDGIKLIVPPELGNQKLAALGYVDVTATPFRADPTGKRDATVALQQAIEFARDAQMVCFLPSGTYMVSDTLLMRHGVHMRSHRATFINNKNMPCVLVGSRRGPRPRIVLCENSPGFTDPESPKPIVEHWQYQVKRFKIDRTKGRGGGGSLMNTMFINIDIVVGRGNAGAVGMHIRSCEGSALQDVTIDVTHGHTGLLGGTSNGGSWANITVIGGRFGLRLVDWGPPTPTMAGIALRYQTEAAIVSACRGALTAVGLDIVSRVPGPVIVGKGKWGAFNAGMSLIDSRIVFDREALAGKQTVAISSERSVYLNNVYVQGADVAVAEALPGNPRGWLRINEFAIGKIGKPTKGHDLAAPIYVDGKKTPGPLRDTTVGVAPPEDLVSAHVWEPDFPSWELSRPANVKAAPYNAKGDSHADDTAALQRAIDENEVIFLPKGYYRVTKTLHLKPNTKLIGVAQHLSVIMARDPGDWPGSAEKPTPLIETADDPEADTVLAFLGIRFPRECKNSFQGATLPVYALKWQCGRRSILRACETEALRVYGFKGSKAHKQPPMDHASILITGNGGGKWYSYHAMQFFAETTQSQRAILIEGTRQPLHFYNFEPQGGEGLAVAEIRNSRNVSLYGCKTECDTTFLRVVDSDHIRIFGHGGIGNPKVGGALYVFERTPNFLIANVADQAELGPDKPYYAGNGVNRNIEAYFPLSIAQAVGKRILVPSVERPVLYRMGRPKRPAMNREQTR